MNQDEKAPGLLMLNRIKYCFAKICSYLQLVMFFISTNTAAFYKHLKNQFSWS